MSGLSPPRGADPRDFERAMQLCEELAAKDSSNLYVVSQFMRDRRRYEAFIAMYSVMRVIDDLVDAVPNVNRLERGERDRLCSQLDRWEERIASSYTGGPGGEELDIALAAAVSAFPVPRAIWSNFLRAMRADLLHDKFETHDSFLDYAEGATVAPTAIYIYLLCAEPADGAVGAGGAAPGSVRYEIEPRGDGFDFTACGRELGIFAYTAHILRDVAHDIRMGEQGRIYVPLSDIAHAGLTESAFREIVRGTDASRRMKRQPTEGEIATATDRDPRWAGLVGTLVQRARGYERSGARMARSRYPAMSPDCRFILALIIQTYARLLDEIERDPWAVLPGGRGVGKVDRATLIREAAAESGYLPAGLTELTGGVRDA